jgi:hypothetical protein
MPYPKLSDKSCKYCSKTLIIKKKRDETKDYCNLICLGSFRKSTRIIKNCANCNSEFKTIPSKDFDCCSIICSKKYKSDNKIIHIRICQGCGNSFQLFDTTNEKNRGWGKYCSHTCVRKYKFNENYFDSIDTEQKAYWLGFLFADGNVYRNQMTLKLSNLDKLHLELFKKHLQSEHLIYDELGKYSSLVIGSKKFSESLISNGCVRKKSLIIEFPILQNDLVRHFIRGVFDGDGCISFIKKNPKYKRWCIASGSKRFIESIKEVVEKEINYNLKLYKRKNIYVLVSGKKNIVKSIFDFMYKDATVYLDRKYQKFLL